MWSLTWNLCKTFREKKVMCGRLDVTGTGWVWEGDTVQHDSRVWRGRTRRWDLLWAEHLCSPSSECWSAEPQGDNDCQGDLWEAIRSWGWPPQQWDQGLYKKRCEGDDLFVRPMHAQQEGQEDADSQEESSHQELSQPLRSWTSRSGTLKDQFILFKSPRLWCLWQPSRLRQDWIIQRRVMIDFPRRIRGQNSEKVPQGLPF